MSLPFLSKVKWEQNPTAMVTETTVLKPVAAYVSLAGKVQTALSPSVPVTARTVAAAWTESVSASRASPATTAQLRSALWTAEQMASVWAAFASVQRVTLVKTALRLSASTTAETAATVMMDTVCVMSPGLDWTALN